LRTDPRDVGCDQALRILQVYVELVLAGESRTEAARRYPGVAAHLLSCGPCAEDYQGLLLAARADPGVTALACTVVQLEAKLEIAR
jgi:hypothetical protein